MESDSIKAIHPFTTIRLLPLIAVAALITSCASTGLSAYDFHKTLDKHMSDDGLAKAMVWAKSERDGHPLPQEIQSDTWKDSTWNETKYHFSITKEIIESLLQQQANIKTDCNAVTDEYRAAVDAMDTIYFRFNRIWINREFMQKSGEIADCIYASNSPDRVKLITRVYLSTMQLGESDSSLYSARQLPSAGELKYERAPWQSLIAALRESGDVKGARQIAAYEAVIRPKQIKIYEEFIKAVQKQFQGSEDYWGKQSVELTGNANIFAQVAAGLKSAGYNFYLQPYATTTEILRYKAERAEKASEQNRKNQQTSNMINGFLLSAASTINASNVAQPRLSGSAGQMQAMSNNLNSIMLQTLTIDHNQKLATQSQVPVADLLRDALKEYESKNK